MTWWSDFGAALAGRPRIAARNPHDGDTCEWTEKQLENAWGDLNAIALWVNRRGVTIERRDDGTFAYTAALSEVLRRAKREKR